MTGIEYTCRAYQDGDEAAINELYRQVTGRLRSDSQFRWQWLEAPAGRGEIWLIEASLPSGEKRLIGHHGMMPIRFSCGDQDFLFGKTENTMVLPEYRQKILYPRFEKRFMEIYEGRFHALFSTLGPAAAIRQRQAMGYRADHSWCNLEHAVSPFGSPAKLALRYGYGKGLSRLIAALPSSLARTSCSIQFLEREQARESLVLDGYWAVARQSWGVSPRRDRADLNWRFWCNPYVEYVTLVFDYQDEIIGYAVIDPSDLPQVRVVDVSFVRPELELVGRVLRDMFGYLANRYPCGLISLLVCDDTFADLDGEPASLFRAPMLAKVRQALGHSGPVFKMPRKVTPLGLSVGLSASGWGVTPMLLEGRA